MAAGFNIKDWLESFIGSPAHLAVMARIKQECEGEKEAALLPVSSQKDIYEGERHKGAASALEVDFFQLMLDEIKMIERNRTQEKES